jgi:hypothetical protein
VFAKSFQKVYFLLFGLFREKLFFHFISRANNEIRERNHVDVARKTLFWKVENLKNQCLLQKLFFGLNIY